VRRLTLLSLALVPLAVACERRTSNAPAGSRGAGTTPVSLQKSRAASVAPSSRRPEGDVTAWVPALRSGRYEDAARALDRLGSPLSQPELRFARARAARELGDHGRALELLSGLEKELPALSERIQRERAEASFGSGSFAAAAAYYEKEGGAAALARAALAREKAGEHKEAIALATRVVSTLKGKRQRSVEALARDVRARAAINDGKRAQAIADLRWLMLDDPVGWPDADERLASLSPKRAPTKEERLGRALSLGRSGERARAEAELEALAKATGPRLSPARVARARAFAWYYSREDYRRASELFQRAAAGPGVDAAEARFYAARSLARAQADADAIKGYEEVIRRFPRSRQAEQSAYLIARTHYAAGAFADAITAYDSYLGRHGKRARSQADAFYERGVAALALGRYPLAVSTFSSLAARERDPRRKARLRQLEASARVGAGERERGREVLADVIRDYPLSFASLAATARLAQLGESVPEPIPPGPDDDGLPPLTLTLPPAVALLHRLGLDRDAEEELRGSERTLTRPFGTRSGEAACTAHGLLDAGARRYQIAQHEVAHHTLMVAPTARTRWQWDCVYPRPFADAVREAAEITGVPPALLYAVMRQESAFRPGVSSPAGAQGLMQILPSTAERIAAERGRPEEATRLLEPGPSVWLSAQYLRKLLDAFGGSVPLSLASYNAGPVAVRRWLMNAKNLPLDVFVARIPYGETLEYVERVVGNYARYRYLEKGVRGVPELSLTLPPIPPADAAPY
jgi:soluble lytic murein transglycosylase